MGKKSFLILAIAYIAMVFTACSEHDFWNDGLSDNRITFSVDIADGEEDTRAIAQTEHITVSEAISDFPEQLYVHTMTEKLTGTLPSSTRGTLVENENLNTLFTEFGVSACRYNKSTENATMKSSNFLYDAQVTKNGTHWTTSQAYYWPNESQDHLCFYAYYPYSNSNMSISAQSDLCPLKITYKVSNTPEQQIDLMTAKADGLTFSEGEDANLTFSHQLTAINFELGGTSSVLAGYIKKIWFENIYMDGTLTIGGNWDISTSALKNDTIIFTEDGINTQTYGSDTYLNPNSLTLLMIPQKFTRATQRLYVTIVDEEGESWDLYVSLKDTQWEAGKKVTYKITTTAVNFARVNEVNYPENWSNDAFSIKTDYTENDAIGLFTVDKSTGKIIESNYRYYLASDGKWKVGGADKIHVGENYIYYAYYPWRTDANITLPNDITAGTTPTATEFFDGLMNGWTVSNDQSTTAKLTANDLQVAHGTINGSKLAFNMAHTMGLAAIQLEQKTISSTIDCYNLGSDTKIESKTENITVNASGLFTNNLPCRNENLFYFITKAATNTIFSCEATGTYDQWEDNLTANIPVGQNDTLLAKIDPTKTGPFTFKRWKVDYSNGIKHLNIPKDGTYWLEVYGARGGSTRSIVQFYGGKGGYSEGKSILRSGQTVYVCVGGAGVGATGAGQTLSGGYNGGGSVTGYSGWNHFTSSGGGATHMALMDGLLSTLSDNRDKVLIVAGGGGGARDQANRNNDVYQTVGDGGSGGGLEGGSTIKAQGATQTTGYAFGQGEPKTGQSAGGGGWYGGRAVGSGAGGSGYIGGVFHATTTNGVREDNGYAQITSLIPE